MENSFAPLLRLSQSHLNLLEICPPQFEKVYLEQLTSPMSPHQQEKITWGNRFHLLMQQRELGLPINALREDEKVLYTSLQSLLESAPEIAHFEPKTWRRAEHYRTLMVEGYLFTVIYDLLICYPKQAKIFDWKTYPKPEKPEKLGKNWQTRLYLYLLGETSDYTPEQISMTYWFVRNKPQSLTFSYNREAHKQTQKDLIEMLAFLTHCLETKITFPHRTHCHLDCPYWYPSSDSRKIIQPALEEIEEVNPFI